MCALCRTETIAPPPPYPAWVLGGILIATVVVSAGALGYRAFQSLGDRSTKLSEERPAPPARAEPPALDPGSANAPAAPMAAQPVEQTGESVPVAAPLPPPASLEAVSVAASQPTAAKPSRPAPSEAELRAALSATPVVMYATSWCGACRQARQFLSESGFKYQEIDADKTPGGWDKVQQLGGRRAVPVIVVDGDVSVGLDSDRIMKAAAASMERRLGVTGIHFRSN